MYNRRELKKSAKALLRGSVPHFMLVSLVYVLLTTGVGYVLDMLDYTGGIFSGVLSTFANILLFLFSMVMAVGLCNYALRLSRKEPTGMGSLFEGFAFTGRSLGVELLVLVFSVLWGLLVMVAAGVVITILGILSAFFSFIWIVDVLFAVLMGLVYAAAVVVLLFLILRYGMAAFALVDDPGLGAGECLRRSKAMMRKNLGKLFWLQLSFIGWIILAALIAAIVQGVGLALLGPEQLMNQAEEIFMMSDTYEMLLALESFAYDLQYQLRWWVILGEILALPLTLWLTVYRQAALAQFYNFASGYDYHRYMHDAPADSLDPPGGYYHSPSDGGGNQ
ncbi:MAG: DUF975 family protein [Oscillospiraceae bacterium]|nr:DUF975 family protein [Oscillospiraceae bacterium]